MLNSVTLRLGSPVGFPTGFEISLYSGGVFPFPRGPETKIATLIGPDPLTAGDYTYTAINLALLPSKSYFIVVTSATSTNLASYSWGATRFDFAESLDAWSPLEFALSADGNTWRIGRGSTFLFSVNARSVPEPSCGSLFPMGLGIVALIRRRVRDKPGQGHF